MNHADAVMIMENVNIKNSTGKKYVYCGIKRLFDIMMGLIALIMLIPIALGIKIATLLSGDKHPIFFKQERIGKNGKTFSFYKFRSMIPDADKVLEQTLKMDKLAAEEYKINKKLKDDPRITKIGKFIRKFSLDELPQVINILKGDMSFIGNRPYLPREKEDMTAFYDDIVKTKPGLTGWWQVNGRSDVTFRKRLELESYYSKNQSLWLDIKIFFKTFKVVFLGRDSK